jgi:single-stranded DNA-binding protein
MADTHVTLVGNLVDDPELKVTVGVPIPLFCRIGPAISRDAFVRAWLTFKVQ